MPNCTNEKCRRVRKIVREYQRIYGQFVEFVEDAEQHSTSPYQVGYARSVLANSAAETQKLDRLFSSLTTDAVSMTERLDE